MKELAAKYQAKEIEKGKYETWIKKGYFESGDLSKKPFTIVIPPPNVTGKLHLGHAWDSTLQDIIIRRKRMMGFDTLYLPGMDHAGIATQAKVDAKLREQGISRYDLGREKFLDVAWQWKNEYAEFIREQWAALGVSVDYTKERFTLDEGLNHAVNKVFVTLYEKGLIYRGERIINWDVQAKTALSNIEVEYKEKEGAFYHFKYILEDGSDEIIIATTRPETIFGDTALMVHPDDERYTKYIGKRVVVPGTDRTIPIIADDYVDMDFGTGAVKVTPAHDPNDFEVGQRHDLPMPICMNEDGTMNEQALEYEGLDRFECRKKLVDDLKEIGLCIKIESIKHNVGHSERTGVVVEPRLSKQWFVAMEPLSKQAREQSTVEFVPSRFEKTFKQWMDGTYDWCISRQLWWGHRIPAWYRNSEVYVGLEAPEGDGWKQDEDVLDTWFSSALWPFSTLGWPDDDALLKRYYPTDVLVTGYDIIFFWVARMIFQGIEFTGTSPFKHCLIHGLIRDKDGRKMSKSLGNGVDPIDIKNQYGIDTLRYFLTTNSAPGQDLRFEIEKVESSWNFINKLWNISRFVIMNLGEFNYEDVDIKIDDLLLHDKYILSRLQTIIQEMDYNYEKFEFGEAAKSIHSFAWEEFASWYVEIAKLYLSDAKHANTTKSVLSYVLLNIMKMLHPFMPFVTEEIFQNIPHIEESIVISSWPVINETYRFKDAENDFVFIQELIKAIRNIKAEYKLAPSKALRYTFSTSNENVTLLKKYSIIIDKFINPESIEYSSISPSDDAVSIVLKDITVMIPLGELVDIDAEKNRLQDEMKRLEKEIIRCEKMLANDNFIAKAPKSKVDEERKKKMQYEEQYNMTKNRFEEI
jgi:valyl-tRNA synthetase